MRRDERKFFSLSGVSRLPFRVDNIYTSLRDVIYNIKYKFYIILSKTRYVRRFTHKDVTRITIPVQAFNQRRFARWVDSKLFDVQAIPHIEKKVTEDVDYFYTEKDGHKKIRFVAYDHYSEAMYMICTLDNLYLCIGKQRYRASSERLPIINLLDITKDNKYRTIKYDLTPVAWMSTFRPVSSLETKELLETYDECRHELEKWLRSITIKDLEVNNQ